MSCPGRYIKIEFDSTDASTAAAVVLYDDQQNVVTLGSDEMLRIDSLNISVAADITVEVFADADGDGAVDDGERLAEVGQGTHLLEFDKEGLACPTGVTPSVHASGAGGIVLIGTARLFKNNSPATRPTWREDTHQS